MAMTDAGRKKIESPESVDDILGDDLRVEKTPALEAFDRGLRKGYALRLQDTRDELREVDAHRRNLLHVIADLRAKVGAAPETRELL